MLSLFIFLFSLRAESSTTPAPSPHPIYKEFVTACIAAFSASAGTEENGGEQICTCTAEESKHQGVTIKELTRETSQIKKDPKYKIRNKKLLASIQYCTVLLMEDAEHSQDDAKKPH